MALYWIYLILLLGNGSLYQLSDRFSWPERGISKTFIGKIALVDHALSATNEMKELAYAFDRLKQKCDVKTPNYDYLEKYLMNYGG